MHKIKVIIADDHSLTLEGIKNTISKINSIEIIGTANSGKEVLKLLENKIPDIIITDIEMNNIDGIELSEIIKKKYKKIKIIVITLHSERWIIAKLVKIDVNAIVLKSEISVSEITNAVNEIIEGNRYFSKEIQDAFFKLKLSEQSIPHITNREKEILVLICKEFTIKEIANELFISTSTVETHRKNLFVKLKVKSQSGLVREAIKYGFYNFD